MTNETWQLHLELGVVPVVLPLFKSTVVETLDAKLRGRNPVCLGSGFVGFGCCQAAIFDPKKLPIPPIVPLTSGNDEAAGVVEVVGVDWPSRSRNRFVTSDRTPSNALKKVDDPAARADPIASLVGPS
jgi:hypothetical protein